MLVTEYQCPYVCVVIMHVSVFVTRDTVVQRSDINISAASKYFLNNLFSPLHGTTMPRKLL
jgi:hypothetical protein